MAIFSKDSYRMSLVHFASPSFCTKIQLASFFSDRKDEAVISTASIGKGKRTRGPVFRIFASAEDISESAREVDLAEVAASSPLDSNDG